MKPASGSACPSVCPSVGLKQRELLVVLDVEVSMATLWQLMVHTVHTEILKSRCCGAIWSVLLLTLKISASHSVLVEWN